MKYLTFDCRCSQYEGIKKKYKYCVFKLVYNNNNILIYNKIINNLVISNIYFCFTLEIKNIKQSYRPEKKSVLFV